MLEICCLVGHSVQFSNHTGYKTFTGDVLQGEQLRKLVAVRACPSLSANASALPCNHRMTLKDTPQQCVPYRVAFPLLCLGDGSEWIADRVHAPSHWLYRVGVLPRYSDGSSTETQGKHPKAVGGGRYLYFCHVTYTLHLRVGRL